MMHQNRKCSTQNENPASFDNDSPSVGGFLNNEGTVTPVALNRLRMGAVSSDQKKRNGAMSGNGKPMNAQRDSCPNLGDKYDSI